MERSSPRCNAKAAHSQLSGPAASSLKSIAEVLLLIALKHAGSGRELDDQGCA